MRMKDAGVQRLFSKLRGGGPLAACILLFLAVFAACVLYVGLITKPMESFDISPATVPDRWTFALPDGRALTPQDGRLQLPAEHSEVVCRLQITEALDAAPMIAVSAAHADCVFELDGALIYSPSGRYQEGRFSDVAYEKSAATGQFSMRNMHSGSLLTMIAQFQGDENRISRLPKITLYPGTIMYLTKYIAPVSEDAMMAGICFTITAFVAVLFLVGLWRGRKNAGMILTALCSLSTAFSYTNSFSHQATVLFHSPAFVWFYSTLPQLTMAWLLWHLLSSKLRLWTLPVPGSITGWIIVILIGGFTNTDWNARMNAVSVWLLPGVLFLLLLIAALDAIRGNERYRRFFRYVLWIVLAACLATGCSALINGKLASTLVESWTRATTANYSLYQLASLVSMLLLLACFMQAAMELITGLARQDAEIQSLALREKSAVESMTVMRRSQEETYRHRHEMQHHLVVLEELIAQSRSAQASEYIHRLLDEIAAVPRDRYCDNLVINAIAGYYLNAARAEGIRVEADIRTPGSLPVKDEEICVVVANLLENALEACRAMGPDPERFISLTLSASREHLMILCENSTRRAPLTDQEERIPSTKPDPRNHGYGIAAVQQIVNRYFGILTIACRDGVFRAELSV